MGSVCGRGDIVVADTRNHLIKRITAQGGVFTIAGSGGGGGDGGTDSSTMLMDGWGREAGFKHPMGVCIAADGSIIVADTGMSVGR